MVLEPEVALNWAVVGQYAAFGAHSLLFCNSFGEHDDFANGSYDTVVTYAVSEARLPAVDSVLPETKILYSVLCYDTSVRLN